MKDTKRRMEIFSTYDYCGIQRHLTKMAKRGWMLTEIGNFTWIYRRCEPCDARFAVTYFPEASAFDPEPGEDQRTYIEYCEEAGWELCASSAKMQVFRAVRDDAVEIETDGEVQLKTVHRAMKSSYLPWCWTMLGLGLLEGAMEVDKFLRDPIDALLGMNTLLMILSIIVLVGAELINYGIWYLRAKKSLKNGGGLPKTTSTRPLQIIVILLALAELILWMTFDGMDGTIVMALVSMAVVFGMLGLTFLIRYILKKKKVDAGLSKTIVLTACVLIPLIGIPIFGIVTFNVIMNGTFSRAEVVDYHGMKVRMYHDELPLTVEDLTEVPEDAQYSRQLERESSLFLRRIEGRQQDPVFEERSLPDLEYTVTVTKIPQLYDMVLEELLEENQDFFHTFDVVFETEDCTVYQAHFKSEWYRWWVFAMDDRVIEMYFDEHLTDEQLDTVIGKLSDVK